MKRTADTSDTPPLFELPAGASAPLLRAATMSSDGRYRYHLLRRWGDPAGPVATVVMLNPSTADATEDDPTIRRCIGFAHACGAAGLHVLNLYALRATDPRALWRAADPVGPRNDEHLAHAIDMAAASGWPLIAAWGVHARPDRVAVFLRLADRSGAQVTALGLTQAGAPRHPLYLPRTATPTPWPDQLATIAEP